MTSQRKLKKTAAALGLTSSGLQMAQLMEEVLGELRFMQILAYSNQFLMNEKLEVSQEERDRVLKAAAAAVDGDGRLQAWQGRLAELKRQMQRLQQELGAAPVEGSAEAGDG